LKEVKSPRGKGEEAAILLAERSDVYFFFLPLHPLL